MFRQKPLWAPRKSQLGTRTNAWGSCAEQVLHVAAFCPTAIFRGAHRGFYDYHLPKGIIYERLSRAEISFLVVPYK